MTRRALMLGLALVPLAVVLVCLAVTDALAPTSIPGLPDPGVLTRLGLPLTQVLRDLAAAVTVGSLVMAACVAPPEPGASPTSVAGARKCLLQLAVRASSVWVAAALVLLTLTYSDVNGSSVGSPGFADQVLFFAQSFDVGRYQLVTATLAGVVCVGSMLAQRIGTVGVLTVLAIAALWPIALTGHAAGTFDHDQAVDLLMMHLVGVSVWFGGLVALALTRLHWGEALVPAVARYSRLAGWCLGLVVVSGVLGAVLRLDSFEALASEYGALLMVKVVAVGMVAVLGLQQRRSWISRLRAGHRNAFWRGALTELALMGVATGAGVALARTAPPPPPWADQPLTLAEDLLGAPMPPALGAAEWFTQWRPDTFWTPVAILALVLYLGGVARLRDRGDRWPITRTVSWVVGTAMLLWAVSGSPGVYGRVLFSMHMVQHMTLATAVPVFLVLGAPVTLALRALRRRGDGSRGPREWLHAVVHSLPAQVFASPIVAAGLFIVSLVAFYYSSLLELSLRTHTAHLSMVLHFLLAGYLFANCLVGVDPGPRRPSFPLRALVLMVTFGFHALFSVTLMAQSDVLARKWFEPLGRTWGASLIDDQYLGASLGWLLGDYPLALLAIALIVLWLQADRRERRRCDRGEARDGDRQLTEYNAYLSSIAARDSGTMPNATGGPRDASSAEPRS